MVMKPLSEPKGECPICEVNLYEVNGKNVPDPRMMPCGIHRATTMEAGKPLGKEECPFETLEEYERAFKKWAPDFSKFGSSLDAID